MPRSSIAGRQTIPREIAAGAIAGSGSLVRRLRQPEAHVHLAVHRRGGTEVFGLGPRGPPLTELGEPAVTMRDERAHPQLGGQRQRLLISALGVSARRWIASRVDLAEEPQGVRLVAALAVCAGQTERALGLGVRLLETAGQQMGLAQRQAAKRLKADHLWGQRLFQGPGEERR